MISDTLRRVSRSPRPTCQDAASTLRVRKTCMARDRELQRIRPEPDCFGTPSPRTNKLFHRQSCVGIQHVPAGSSRAAVARTWGTSSARQLAREMQAGWLMCSTKCVKYSPEDFEGPSELVPGSKCVALVSNWRHGICPRSFVPGRVPRDADGRLREAEKISVPRSGTTPLVQGGRFRPAPMAGRGVHAYGPPELGDPLDQTEKAWVL